MADWKELLTFIDRYDFLARLLPATLLSLPVVPPWWLLVGDAVPWWALAIVGLPLLSGVSLIVAGLGRRFQAGLWARQGGPPSTRLCRWGDPVIEKCRKQQMHDAIATHFGIELHSARKEPHNLADADRLIRAGFDRVRELLLKRDPNGLWFRHLIEYGFARNALTVTGWSAAGWLASAILCGIVWLASGNPIGLVGLVVGLVVSTVLALVTFLSRDAIVTHLGERYALSAWTAFLSLGSSPPAPPPAAASANKPA
jgi:hypothetical protein